jgi:multiple sugar transport system permease protein
LSAKTGVSSAHHLLSARPAAEEAWRPGRRPALSGSETIWAIVFLLPYAVVFLAFAAYPIAYGFWMACRPSLYVDLFADPLYLRTAVNTLLYVGLAVNVKMVLALLLSGFFMQRRWWAKALLAIFVLPWTLPAVPAFLSIHWMLIGDWGLIDAALQALLGVDGPIWFNHGWLALGCDIAAYIWKWLPFWTLVFLAARMAIPQELYEAADIDGAAGMRRFALFTVPLLANVYLVCTLLSTLWAVGDFSTVFFVSGGAPALTSEVLATVGIRYAYDLARPELGVAAALSAFPVLIPIALLLMRRLRTGELQL